MARKEERRDYKSRARLIEFWNDKRSEETEKQQENHDTTHFLPTASGYMEVSIHSVRP